MKFSSLLILTLCLPLVPVGAFAVDNGLVGVGEAKQEAPDTEAEAVSAQQETAAVNDSKEEAPAALNHSSKICKIREEQPEDPKLEAVLFRTSRAAVPEYTKKVLLPEKKIDVNWTLQSIHGTKGIENFTDKPEFYVPYRESVAAELRKAGMDEATIEKFKEHGSSVLASNPKWLKAQREGVRKAALKTGDGNVFLSLTAMKGKEGALTLDYTVVDYRKGAPVQRKVSASMSAKEALGEWAKICKLSAKHPAYLKVTEKKCVQDAKRALASHRGNDELFGESFSRLSWAVSEKVLDAACAK